MAERPTISPDYLAAQRELHKNTNYGTASIGFAPIMKQLLEISKAKSLSDYGAGKQNLMKALKSLGKTDFEYFPYDPAFPEYGPPKPADLVCCIDVLEHIEIDYLDAVLSDLRDITRSLGFLSVATGPAAKVLADGRNAHLIQQPSSWWLPRLREYFEIRHLQRAPGRFWVVTQRRQTKHAMDVGWRGRLRWLKFKLRHLSFLKIARHPISFCAHRFPNLVRSVARWTSKTS